MVDRWHALLGAPPSSDVVVGVKDVIDIVGQPTTLGTAWRKTVAARDAAVVDRVRCLPCAGLVKTNLDEYAFGGTGRNPTYGDVVNPRFPDRISGGSSSGSTAAVAAGLCSWALGTDTGGSVRIPAALCGVVGYKPSVGRLPTRGVHLVSETLDTVGIAAPSVAMAREVFEQLTGSAPTARKFAAPLRLGWPRAWITGLDQWVASAWAARERDIPEVPFPDREELVDIQHCIASYEVLRKFGAMYARGPESFGPEASAYLDSLRDVSLSDYRRAQGATQRVRSAAARAFRDLDALVLPTTACIAPLATSGVEVLEPLTRFVKPFNTLGGPAISIPVPTLDGMTAGIQVVGPIGADAEVLAVAVTLESEMGGPMPCLPAETGEHAGS